MGRVTGSNQVTGNLAYPFSYTYNLAGGMTTETYPSGRVATTSFDGAERQSGVSGALSGQTTNYVAGAIYWPHGAEWAMTYGNNVVPVVSYNNRLQVSNVYATIGNNSNEYLLFLGYTWGATNNNGTLATASEGYGASVPVGSLAWLNQSYSYDGVNRLSSVSDSGYSRSFQYDAYGNMWVPAGATGVQPASNTPASDVFDSHNRISGSSYDAAGNQLSVNGNTSAYDAENRQVSVTEAPAFGGGVEQYLYDGLGHRIEKAGPSGLTVYVYDVQSRLIGEYGTTGATSPCTTCYLVADLLGTPRLVTDAGAKIIGRHDYLPFGEEIAANTGGRNALWGPAVDTITQKFTGKERDSESGLDYFGARYYGSALGRFTSPDPGNTGSDPRDPQSWNAFAYTGNNPLSRVDPNGLDYSICTNDGNGGQQCSYVANDQAAQEALANPGSGLSASNGNIYSTDENGNQIQVGTYQHFLGPGDMASDGLHEDYGFELGALGLGRGAAGLFGGAAASAARSAIWSLAPTVRGGVIEEMLGANLPRTFPVIDSFADGVATSIKSVDLSAASYQAPDALASRLTGYVDKLASFPGGALGGAEVDGAQITGRVLKLAVPEGGVSGAQQAVINRVTAAAAQKGVQVVVVGVR